MQETKRELNKTKQKPSETKAPAEQAKRERKAAEQISQEQRQTTHVKYVNGGEADEVG